MGNSGSSCDQESLPLCPKPSQRTSIDPPVLNNNTNNVNDNASNHVIKSTNSENNDNGLGRIGGTNEMRFSSSEINDSIENASISLSIQSLERK